MDNKTRFETRKNAVRYGSNDDAIYAGEKACDDHDFVTSYHVVDLLNGFFLVKCHMQDGSFGYVAPTVTTNIKGLPEYHIYFTELGYSQSYPWVEVARSASGKTVTLAQVMVDPDPEWKAKKEFIPGGFFGHCPNQNEQTWLFASFNKDYTKKVRLCKNGQWRQGGMRGTRFIENRAVEFYDYNF